MLEPRDIRKEWDRISGPLGKVLNGMDERPEDVYADCVHGDAHVYMAGEDGFVVLRKTENRFTGEGELVIWVASLFDSVDAGSAVEKYKDAMFEIARKAGCKRIVYRRTRGSLKAGGGWVKTMETYEIAVP